MNMDYKIEFFSNWHCGSGLAAGADVDALVVKDKDGLPYVPGRTIKGLLRDAATELGYAEDYIIKVFGKDVKQNDKNAEQNGNDGEQYSQAGCAFFSNAELSKHEAAEIVKGQLTPYLYQTFASTAIDDNGIAKDGSLRRIETVVPCTLYASINGIGGTDEKMLMEAMMYIKRMGTDRNRGYGRCKISIGKEDQQ